MLLKDKVYLYELREQFLQKIVDEWELKWQEDFEEFVSFEALKSKNAFLESLLADIEEDLHRRLSGEGKKYLFSKDFLRRFIFEYGGKEVRIQTHSRTGIALYLGYENWEDFLKKNKDLDNQRVNINYVSLNESLLPALRKAQLLPLSNESFATFQELKPRSKKYLLKFVYGVFALALVAGGFYWLFNWWVSRPFSTDEIKDVQFKVIKTVGQYPQAVRIMYDLGKIRRVKNVEVELGVGKIVSVNSVIGYITSSNKLKDTISQTYFYPGIYHLALSVNNRRIKDSTHVVYSYPNKWKSWAFGVAYEKSWITNISTVNNYIKNGVLHFDPANIPNEIKDNDKDLRQTVHVLTQNFGVNLDSLTFEARMKNPESEGGEGCHNMEMVAADENFNHLIAGFTMVGCTDYVRLVAGETIFRRPTPHAGKDYDLHEFGVNQDEWSNFKMRISGNIIEVFINERQIFKHDFKLKKQAKEIKDIRFIFNGTGSIDWVKLSNSYTGKVVYETEFEGEKK